MRVCGLRRGGFAVTGVLLAWEPPRPSWAALRRERSRRGAQCVVFTLVVAQEGMQRRVTHQAGVAVEAWLGGGAGRENVAAPAAPQ